MNKTNLLNKKVEATNDIKVEWEWEGGKKEGNF